MSTLGFEMEWFDQVSGLVNKLFLKFFIEDNTIEILQTNQKFLLKRIFYPEVQLKDLYIGNTVTIYNRLMTVKAHANSATTKYMKDIEVRFLCVLPKNEIAFLGQVMLLARKHELRLGKAKTISSVRMRTNVPVEAGDTILEIVGLSKIKVDDLIDEFQRSTPSIRITHATHEDTDELMVKSKAIKVQQDCTLCVMKPHLLKSGRTGELFEYIVTGGFEVVGVFLTHMTIPIVEGLFDIYRGVFDKYAAMIDELSSAPVLAVMLRKESTFNNSVIEFREYCGPVNPLLAKILRPKSLRAIFGEDIVRNAVHCTDLDTDGPLECQYFFDTLANI